MSFTISVLYSSLKINERMLNKMLFVQSRLCYSYPAVYCHRVKLYTCFDSELFTCRSSSSGI